MPFRYPVRRFRLLSAMSLDTWLAFMVASWAICLSPGPGVLCSVTAGLLYGLRGAAWNLLGLQAGALLMLLIVGVGLGTVLAASPLAFTCLKWFGVGYLIWLGIQQWRSEAAPITLPPGTEEVTSPGVKKSAGSLVLRGFLVNSSNPKGMLFTASVLPQFIDAQSPLFPQYVIIELTLLVCDVVSMTGYTLLGTQALRLMKSPTVNRRVNQVFGTIFVVAGLALASFHHSA